jgi:hypothetical protein
VGGTVVWRPVQRRHLSCFPCSVDYWWGGWAMVGLSWAAHQGENWRQARPVKKFRPMTDRRNEKGFLFFQIFFQFQTNLNSNENLNFDDFYSHNKMQEHFTTQGKICIDMKCNKHNYLFI